MAKWIADGSINLKEVPGTHVEQHNAITGYPIFSVRLEVPTSALLMDTLAKLLGEPEEWPHATQFMNVRAISANVIGNPGKYTTDGDEQITLPVNPYFLDVTYTPRHGFYTTTPAPDSKPIYIDDIIEPRIESRPMDFTQIIWGTTISTGIPPVAEQQMISSDVVPSKYEAGEQLIHTLEGWLYDTSPISSLIGTCNADTYTSFVLENRVFDIGTLLLRNVVISKSMSFNSYKLPFATLSGYPTYTVKMIYEYKEIGWQKFWRIGTINGVNVADYYYLRHKSTPYDQIIPFPLADHTPYLF